MGGINDRFNVELKVLTPLAIGAGAEKDWVAGADFIVDGGRLHRLNLQKMVSSGLDLAKLSACFEQMSTGQKGFGQKSSEGIKDLIGNKLNSVTDFTLPLPSGISSDADLKNPVKAFVKNQLTGKPVVPGSSIKGAIRSIILERLTKGDRSGIKSGFSRIFGSPEDGTDFMRFLKFSDIEFEQTGLVNTKIFNLRRDDSWHSWQGGWKHGGSNTDGRFRQTGFNTVYESIVPGQFGIGSLMLSGKMFGEMSGERSESYGKIVRLTGVSGTEIKKNLLQKNGEAPVSLFRAINEHTETYLKREKAFFEKYETDRSRDILDSIGRLLSEVETALEDNTSCIFKMSAGSGFHSITGDWQFSDYGSGELDRKRNTGAKPKSRKIAVYGDGLSLMGFVKMSVASKSEVERYEADMEEKRRAREQAFAAAKAEEDARKKEIEEHRRREQEAERKKVEYNKAVEEAETYYAGICSAADGAEQSVDDMKKHLDCLTKALELYGKAGAICPDGTLHKTETAKVEAGIRITEQKIAEVGAQGVRINAGLSLLDEKTVDGGRYKVTNFKQVKNLVDSWLKKSGNANLPEEQDRRLETALRRIYCGLGTKRDERKEKENFSDFTSSVWKTVTQWCGGDRAKLIFESVVR